MTSDLEEQPVGYAVLQAVGTQLQVVREGAPGGQLHYDGEGAEGHAHQRHDPGVVEVAHDGQLLAKVLVLLHALLPLVGPPKQLHCHRLTSVASGEDLQWETVRSRRQPQTGR